MSHHGHPEPERLTSASKSFQEESMSQGTIEVLVETLTGTVFEMTVSPDDTIFAIKSKIYRVEGIPVAQQHLLHNLKELDDSASLQDYNITDGSRLKLVLSMRGGPISTRRLPSVDDVHWKQIRDLVEGSRDETSEWIRDGCKMSVLVFRDGDNVNLIRVVRNQDGSYSPISDTNSSTRSLVEEPLDDGISCTVAENAVTMGKMLDLRRRMEDLSLQRTRHVQHRNKESTSKLIQKTRSEEILLDHSTDSLFDSSMGKYRSFKDTDYSTSLLDGDFPTRYGLVDSGCTLLPPIGGYQVNSESSSSLSTCNMRQYRECESPTERIKLTDALAGSILVKSPRGEDPEEETTNVEETTDTQHAGGVALRWGSTTRLALCTHAQVCTHTQAPLYSSSTSDLEALRRNRILPALSRHRNRSHLHLSDDSLATKPTRELATEPRLKPTLPPHRLEVGGERRRRRENFEAGIRRLPNENFLPTPETTTALRRLSSDAFTPTNAATTVNASTKSRCSLCRKRLSVATRHECRCGKPYCAPHRYAEVHACNYDYKAERLPKL